MFNKIFGNSLIKNSLQNSIQFNKVSHSYIFSGERGCGKKLISHTFAKTLQCKKQGVDPCLTCTSCIAFENNNHPDIFYIQLKKTATIGVSQIKEAIISEVDIKPYNSPYKIFIIDDSHKITIQAQNALLKVIEEPNPYCIFIFLTENFNNFLPTILSRCILYKINSLSVEDIKSYLSINYNLDENYTNLISTYTSGNIGRAIMLSNDSEFIELRDFFSDIPKALEKKDTVEVLFLAKQSEKFKDRIQEGLDILYIYYRDILVEKETKNRKHLLQQVKPNEIIYNFKNSTTKSLCTKLDAILDSKIKLQQYSNFQLTIEMLFLQLKEN